MSHVTDQIWDWIHGALAPSESAAVEHHLEQCDDCQAALRAEYQTLAAFERSRGDCLSEAGRARLMADATTLARFARYVSPIALLADVTADVAKGWLSVVDDPSSWSPTALEHLHLFHIDGGPAVADAIVGFVRLAPETEFPEHTHVGDEAIFVIQGTVVDEHGVEHPPGSLVERDPGSTHVIRAKAGHPAIYLSVVHEGLEVFGMRFGPDSPEW